MDHSLSVGLGEQVVSANPEDILVAYGLGSCLGIAMYDPTARVAGLAHAVLPEPLNPSEPVTAKYVRGAIETLLKNMLQQGAEQKRIILRMAGGANMLATAHIKMFDIGTRNIQVAHQTFDRMNLRIANEEIGGHTGRTVRLYVADGRMTVRVIGCKEHDL